MRPVSEREIRRSFVNCSKGEASRLALPRELAELPWDDLDFLGWRDPGAPHRAHLVAERGDRLVGLLLRATSGTARGFTARGMCSLCLTTHASGGVALMAAARTGEAGRQGNSFGTYLCADLACSLYARGRKRSVSLADPDARLTPEEKVARLRRNLDGFLANVLG